MSPVYFEPEGPSSVFESSNTLFYKIAYTDACKTYYTIPATTFFLKTEPWVQNM